MTPLEGVGWHIARDFIEAHLLGNVLQGMKPKVFE
jgi:hypothetical protein